jgi:LytS/YehU family sensor histidine kinase
MFAPCVATTLLAVDQQTIQQIALFGLIPFVVAFLFVVFVFYRKSRESRIQQELTMLELTALRAQMNPHFIFNCLNAIYNSIQANRNEEASAYLLKFAYLTRRILENSNNKWIPLDEEVEMLKAYCALEQIRLATPFHFDIQVRCSEDQADPHVPMLLIQPLIENIVWHGLSQTPNAYIRLTITSTEEAITYTLCTNVLYPDSGATSPAKHGKKKSLGRKLVTEQLTAIGHLTGCYPVFEEKTIDHGGVTEQQTLLQLPHVQLPTVH